MAKAFCINQTIHKEKNYFGNCFKQFLRMYCFGVLKGYYGPTQIQLKIG